MENRTDHRSEIRCVEAIASSSTVAVKMIDAHSSPALERTTACSMDRARVPAARIAELLGIVVLLPPG